MNFPVLVLLGLCICSVVPVFSDSGSKKSKIVISELTDIKDLKKLIKSKTNVLICFGNGKDSFSRNDILVNLKEVAELVRGVGTIATVDCAADGKKLCKKVKVSPASGHYILKHYDHGEFNKDYDRATRVASIVNFLRDPKGDLPWDEDETSQDIVHLSDLPSLLKLVKRESTSSKGILVMFYAPWCGYCKRMKPDYANAATELKDEAILAAIDVNKPENGAARQKYNITGFPTLLFFRNGQMRMQYEGDNKKDAIVTFMKDPDAPPPEKPKEENWADEPSEVVHLTVDTFDTFIKENPSVLVMFYAPWCGHCKRMKPEYVKAAEQLSEQKVEGKLAAVDATKEVSLGKRFDVQGYPTVKYFKNGEFAFEAGSAREAEAIVSFMKDPTEPPPPPPPEKPWSEEESAVVHLNEDNFKSVLRKKKRALVMFYAPWCGHCKSAKPEFTQAAEELKDDPKVMFGAVDCTLHQPLCNLYDVKGFPTFKIFQYYNKEEVQNYDGGRTKASFTEEFRPGAESSYEAEWAAHPGQEHVEKLSPDTLSTFLKEYDQALVMFYAPWCGHCKKLAPEYALAASKLAKKTTTAKLAAIDCVRFPSIFNDHDIQGYPTLKYFHKGSLVGEYSRGRKAAELVQFMLEKPATRDEL